MVTLVFSILALGQRNLLKEVCGSAEDIRRKETVFKKGSNGTNGFP